VNTVAETAPTRELREIHGARAFGGTLSRFLQLLWLISKTELRTRYQGATFGLVWSVLEPMLLFGVLYAVFSTRVRFGVDYFPVLLLMNIMLYRGIFAGTTGRSVPSVVARESLVRKTQFPRIVVPLSVVVTGLLMFSGDVVVLFAFMFIVGVDPMWTWLLFPVIIALFATITTGMALLLSSLYVRFRDTQQIWGVISLIFFYGSPVIFPVELIPGSLRGVLFVVNPFVPMLEQARIWMLQPDAPALEGLAPGPLQGLLIPALVFVGVCVAGLWVFTRQAPKVAEEI
jgi:ABC-2 type transport system permease protein